MGLAASNIRFLTLTSRKADLEFGVNIQTMNRMALTSEQSQLSAEYYSKLNTKDLLYYSDGQYNKLTYSYLMGSKNTTAIINGTQPIRDDYDTILTDSKGLVVLSDEYANAFISVLGTDCYDKFGRGKTFSQSNIAEIVAKLVGGTDKSKVQTIIDGGTIEHSYTAAKYNTRTSEATGETTTVSNDEAATEVLARKVEIYYPIVLAASSNGWTTEYNQSIKENPDYIGDALASGVLQLAKVNEEGNYNPDASLSYFLADGAIVEKLSTEKREQITAWYNQERDRIAEKERYIDIVMQDFNTELEAIKSELESLKTYIQDAISSVFNWGGGG